MAVAGISSHPAGNLCRTKGANWYLPAQTELNTFYTNNAAVGGFATSENYWSSTEDSVSAGNGITIKFWNAGAMAIQAKGTNLPIRCASRF